MPLADPGMAVDGKNYARDENISTVVVGRGRPGRLRFARSTADAIGVAGDHFDVIEVGRATADPAAAPKLLTGHEASVLGVVVSASARAGPP